MKTAMLTYSLRPRGGVIHALCLAEALQRKGIDITIFSLRRSDSLDKSQGFFRETPVRTEIFEYVWHEDIKDRLRSMTEAIMNGLPKDFDIYHAQDCVCDTALQLSVSEGGIRPPTIRTVHHVEGFQDPFLNKCERNALSGSSEKITVSKYWKEQLKREYCIESTVIYNGIDLSKFNGPSKPRDPFILFVGGMESRKGLEYAIEALEALMRKGFDMRMVAIARPGFKGTESKEWFDHLIERCRLGGRVTIHESVSEEELLKLYSTASAFLLPTRMEGWGLSIMEAMAAGCPVVTTPVGGITELVRAGENGLLVSVGDVEGFAEAVEHLISDKAMRERICAAAKETVKRYSWDASAEKTIDVYNRIIAARK